MQRFSFNRFSLWKSLRRERKHLPACGSRKVLYHWLFLSCQSLYPRSTKFHHSTRDSKCAEPRCLYRIHRQRHSKKYFDCGRTRQTDGKSQSKFLAWFAVSCEHQSIGRVDNSRGHTLSWLWSNYKKPVPFPRRFHNRHKFRQQVLPFVCPTVYLCHWTDTEPLVCRRNFM